MDLTSHLWFQGPSGCILIARQIDHCPARYAGFVGLGSLV